jgi:phosphohistidine swiveling domain-containing protein
MAFADDDVSCAVVLCAMVTTPGGSAPHSAGVAFSCDPRSGRCDLVIINAARGLGEQVVSGVVDPDQIELHNVRGQLQLHSRQASGVPALTPEQEHELAHHVWRIHWALGDGDHPQDIEWAHDSTQFWILQSRPVTGLPGYTFEAIKHLPVIWSTANIKDAVPGVVSIFAWSMIREEIDAILYRGFALREAAKSGMVATLWPIRHLVLELGRRLVVSGHLERPEQAFHLSKADLLTLLRGYWNGCGASALTQDRAAQRVAWLQRHPPDVVIEGDGADSIVPVAAPLPVFDGQVWHGIGVSSGLVTGIARVIRHPAEGVRLGHGEILVAPSTDPGWTPLFLRAGAVVMETGGYLSHGAIVAREYGLPAVVNVPGILDLIKDGETLTMNGDAATVSRIEHLQAEQSTTGTPVGAP